MSTVSQSPSPNKRPDWGLQVKTGRGRSDVGAHHRAIDVASKLFDSGVWDGRGLLIVHDAYDTHSKMQLMGGGLVEGADYEFGEDTMYRREEPADAQVEIDGRAWRVLDEMTLEQVREASPWAASWWQRKGIVARCEVRLAERGRRSYLADRRADGSYSRPFPGSLATPYAAA